MERKISKEGGESFNTAMKADRLKLLLAKLAEEQNAARRAQQDVIQRIGKFDDPFERNFNLGAVYQTGGDFRSSTDRYNEARKAADLLISQSKPTKEYMMLLGTVYGELYRNAIILKDRKAAERIRNDASQRFINPDTKAEEEWWTSQAAALATWSETVYPTQEKNLVRLREEVRANPEDPARIWQLALTCTEGAVNLVEARGYFAWLLENHQEFSQVQNGMCHYRLAEIHFAAREVREAKKRYLDLQTMHKDHPKVSDPGPSGVKRRLDECWKLQFKMGFREDKPK
jgi:tetratricopeptide (TPR) repeat protein